MTCDCQAHKQVQAQLRRRQHSALALSLQATCAGPSVGQHDNMKFMSGAFSNEDGGWLGLPQAALMGKVEGQDTVLLVQLGQ